jgi:hypothetical protein
MWHYLNRIMKKYFLLLLLTSYSFVLFGQNTDTTTKKKIYHHYISVNPFNAFLFQQAGLNYEYKNGNFGMEISGGLIYRNNMFSNRWFVEGPTDYGDIQTYSGYFIIPQLNFYLPKNNINNKNRYFISYKYVHKYLFSDSTQTNFWHLESGGNDYWIYRKQVDRCYINGIFVLFNKRHYDDSFFFDAYFGPGLLWLRHELIVAGQYPGSDPSNISNIKPPVKERLYDFTVTINLGLNLGLRF